MADLVVNYDLLAEVGRNLSSVEQEFKSLHGQVHDLDTGSGWGSDDIRSAMGRFADNWNYHKGKLDGAIDVLLKMVTQTTETFQQVDADLAKQLAADTDGAAAKAHP